MKKTRFGLGKKIFLGFSVLISFFALNAVLSIITLNQSEEGLSRSSDVVEPSMEAIDQLENTAIRSKMLITNWVYLQTNEEDKQDLRTLHNVEYPTLQARVKELSQQWEDSTEIAQMDTILQEFDALLATEKRIMSTLVTFEDYEDPVKKMVEGESVIEEVVLPSTASLLQRIDKLQQQKKTELASTKQEIIDSSSLLMTIVLSLGIGITVVGMLIAYITSRSITRPISYISSIVQQMGRGELPEESTKRFSNDEMGDMAEAVNKLSVGLRQTAQFAENIGQGNLKAEFTPLSENDVLGSALLEMRRNLQQVAEDEARRNWTTEGLARFGEILRQNTNNLAELADHIIGNLVKYTKANQGRIFILNEDNPDDPYLELQGCYAWDRKKHLNQRIDIGEGLAGQAWQENSTIYITDVPDNYVTIRSGLGDANPTCILIVPLRVNEEVFGVIEMASFQIFAPHEVEFVEKIGTSIASTISSVRINQRTSHLLEESQMLTEQMRAQEEEMRQNMEELQATQEEMQRAQRAAHDKEELINSTSLLLETDTRFRIQLTNGRAKEFLGHATDKVMSFSLHDLMTDGDQLADLKRKLEAGHYWQGVVSLNKSNGKSEEFLVIAGSIHTSEDQGVRYHFIINRIATVHTNA
ncbi:GAF domain-containing protein [Catalinimonas alkaloidigena]|nr:GAF domain-containing protein [Catalinimonas alkaloidigena]